MFFEMRTGVFFLRKTGDFDGGQGAKGPSDTAPCRVGGDRDEVKTISFPLKNSISEFWARHGWQTAGSDVKKKEKGHPGG